MATINSFNICNKNISNLFDTLENRITTIEEVLNKIKHIDYNYYKIVVINETLLNENEELKNEIKELKIENKELKNRVNILEIENKELKNRVNILESENKELKNKNLINKIFEAIQDINSIHKLENNIETPINYYLKQLRNNRNDHCHYIKINDNDNIKNMKIKKLLSYLLNLSDESKEYINCICEDEQNIFIDKIIEYLQKLNLTYDDSNITKMQLKYINMWWI